MLYIIFILILYLILYFKKYENFYTTNDEKLLNNFAKIYNMNILFDRNNIKIIKPPNTQKIIIKNFIRIQQIYDFINLRNFTYTTDKNNIISSTPSITNTKPNFNLLFNNNPLDHIYNIYSGYIISKPIVTKENNINYGFVFEYLTENYENNYCELAIDFNSNQSKNIEEYKKIIDFQENNIYENITRKNVNIFTINNHPIEYKDYFTYNSKNKINKIIFVFNSTIYKNFFKEFENNKFNILDYNNNYIFTDLELDIPYCNVNVNDIDDKRDYISSGVYNPILKNYIIFDNTEFTEYKKKNNLIENENNIEIQKYYKKFVCNNEQECPEYKRNINKIKTKHELDVEKELNFTKKTLEKEKKFNDLSKNINSDFEKFMDNVDDISQLNLLKTRLNKLFQSNSEKEKFTNYNEYFEDFSDIDTMIKNLEKNLENLSKSEIEEIYNEIQNLIKNKENQINLVRKRLYTKSVANLLKNRKQLSDNFKKSDKKYKCDCVKHHKFRKDWCVDFKDGYARHREECTVHYDENGCNKMIGIVPWNKKGTCKWYPENFQGYIDEKYKNMTEHFTNKFKDEKFKKYKDIKDCENIKEQNLLKEKYKRGFYHNIDENSILFENSGIIKLLKDLTYFKIRKHSNENIKKYYYGGIDLDGIFKGLGHDNNILLFDTERKCQNNIDRLLENEPNIFSLSPGITELDQDLFLFKNLSIEKKQLFVSKILEKKNLLFEITPADINSPAYVGNKNLEYFKKFSDIKCFQYLKENNTCHHTVKTQVKNFIQDIITFKETKYNSNYVNIIDNNKILKKNKNIMKQIDDRIKDEKLNNNMKEYLYNKENNINYLIEPVINNKTNKKDIGFIFKTFPYKLKIKPVLINGSYKSIIELYFNNKYEQTLMNNNETFYLENENQLHVFVDKKNKFNIQIYDKNNIKLITQFISNKSLKGKFGSKLHLFLRTNNTTMFRNFRIIEKLDSLTYPYNPFINFTSTN